MVYGRQLGSYVFGGWTEQNHGSIELARTGSFKVSSLKVKQLIFKQFISNGLGQKKSLLTGVEIVGFSVTGPRDANRVSRIHPGLPMLLPSSLV